MCIEKQKISIGRKSAGYAFSLWRSGCSDAEFESGYLANTKKEIDPDMCFCLFHWLRSIAKTLPAKTLEAWGGAGSSRKSFFNWFYKLKNQEAFRSFAFALLQEQEKEAAALSAQSDYGSDVDISGYSDLADYNLQEERNRWESWLLSGAGVPAGDPGDISRGAGLSADAPAPGVYAMEEAPF